ncbi:MAG TPA: SpoIIE family protein phosphatase [Terriglobales bacterium]|jgi:sigma-B regulation protein RsbU (phosphoserine phosphatase)|nr:SpoIIE family protein phosphatase [Terriglobales bacterium]
MQLSYRNLRIWLGVRGLLPSSRVARIAWYLLGLDAFLFALQKILGWFKASYGQGLGGWVSFLTFVVIVLFTVLVYRWLKVKLLWRLRNRLIVTYVFIGVIPALLMIVMAAASLYLFSGQFANFVVISELNSQLRSMQAVNAAIANELAARLERGEAPVAESLEGLRRRDPAWVQHQVCAWLDGRPLPLCAGAPPFGLPSSLAPQFREIVRDRGKLYLRAATTLPVRGQKLTVISSEPLDKDLAEKIAKDLGEITLYASGFERLEQRGTASPPAGTSKPLVAAGTSKNDELVIRQGQQGMVVESGNETLRPTFTAGALPAAEGGFDREITFGTPLPVMDWASGEPKNAGALLRVRTRPSILYARLFAALGDFAKGVEVFLLALAIILGVILLPLALLIGVRLTRTVTGAVAQLYEATKHINRGDFSHRIPVKSSDQLATLANSFNSMTASIEKLIQEQREKQRLENELAIAQEVQAQLFPKQISQLASLEVHGFCRPARTVSGDYYDFLSLNSDKLILAVGDISGKGISAALLMATIHSAVRAYSLEGIPLLREPVAVGAAAGSSLMMGAGIPGAEVSPASLLALLNHQLYESTPAEKYATLFLGIYEGRERKLTYSNGGHLPPIVMSEDGSIRRLEAGGTVVGLFDERSYEEDSIQLHRGEIFLAYSDGVTEPENDFGEFGEHRLIELVRENRDLPLARISELVTAAVDDWIGANEQPDDVTLVLARVR